MMEERVKRGTLFNLFILTIITFIVITSLASAATTSITAPTKVTRGGVVNEGTDPVLGSFNVNISSSSGTVSDAYYIGFTINPQNMTGGYCDRPPYFNDSAIINPYYMYDTYPSRTIGSTVLLGGQFYGSSFYKLVPNGIDYPADNPSLVYKYGTRYYGIILNQDQNETVAVDQFPVVINTTYPESFVGGEMSLKPGIYNLHAQKSGGTVDDAANAPIEVVYGTVNITVTPKYENVYTVSGINTDSKKTYLWLTGEGLPECGTNLTFKYGEPVSGDYTLIGNTTLTGIDPEVPGQNKYDPNNLITHYYYENGTWSFDWTIPPTLKFGTYKIYASSVNPKDVSDLPNTNWTSTTGVCGLECDICSPPAASAEFTLGRYDIGDPSIDNPLIHLDCCNNSLCTTCPGYPKMILSGNLNVVSSNGNGFPILVWIFGDSLIGDRPVLFDSFTSFPDGTYEIDLTRMLTDNYVKFCDLENGNYTVLVQSRGMDNGVMHPVFDVTHERLVSTTGRPVFDGNHWYVAGSHPYSKYPISETAGNPGYYPLFPIEGPGSIGGKQALKSVIDALGNNWVHDRYKTVNFTVENKLCRSVVEFTATPKGGYIPLTVQFTDTSSYVGSAWNWNFGDNTNSTEKNPVHVYNDAGIYTVTLSVTNGTTTKQKIKEGYIDAESIDPVYSTPIAAFTSTNVDIKSLTVQLIDQSYGSTPLTYLWDLGDSSKSTERSPIHTYAATGTYNVSLIVTDQKGKSSEAEGNVTIANGPVYTAPVAGFTSSKVDNEPLALQFIDQSYGSTPLVSLWSFGDLQTSTEKSPKHTFTKAGTYLVNLTVTDQYAKANTSSVSVLVPPVTPPTSAFVINPYANDSFKYQFIDKSTGAPYSWFWDFGDNTSSNLNSPNHTYELYGNFPISLTVSNSAGTNTAYSSISLPAPNESVNASVDISEKTGSANTYLFADNSTGPILLWKMTYGDGNVSTFKTSGWNETHTYYDTGNYPATLYVTNGVSSDTVKQMIYIS